MRQYISCFRSRHRACVYEMEQCLYKMHPRNLARRLPTIGPVLYACAASHIRQVSAGAPFLGDAMTLPLMRTHWVMQISMITDEGPYEWCQCLDEKGAVCARFYLLPETDFLAWDELGLGIERVSLPSSLVVACPFRPSCAAVTRFRRRQIAGMNLFEACMENGTWGAFSQQMVARIARQEALKLSKI